MAKKATTKTTVEPTETEAALLAVADFIYKTFGHAAAAPVEEPEEVIEEDVTEEDVEEVDADTDLDAERASLMKESIGTIRKMLIEVEFDADEVKAEKSKAALVDALLADKYGEEDEEDEDETDEDETDEDETDEDETDEDDADDDDDEDDEEDEDDDEGYTEESLKEFSLAELKEIAAEWEVEVKKGARSAAYIAAILEAQDAAEDEGDEEYDEDAEREELEGLSLAALKKTAKNDYGLSAADLKGLDKESIIDLIFDGEDEDDEE